MLPRAYSRLSTVLQVHRKYEWIRYNFVPSFSAGIPTHVYQFGASVMAAGPAIILAQALALFVVLPVFGKAKKEANSINSSVELMASTRTSKSVTLASYIHCRFRSASLDVLVAVLVFALWTFISVSSFMSSYYICILLRKGAIWIVKALIGAFEVW